jgi:hypothetical protein
MVSFWKQLEQAEAEAAARAADPLRDKVEQLVHGMEAISTNALLDLIGLPNTTGNARRISRTMQSLGYVPRKSRRFMPGGWRDSVTRGWARPIRKSTKPFGGNRDGEAATAGG